MNTQTIPEIPDTFDPGNPAAYSAACRALAEQRPALDEKIEAARAEAAATAAKMTVPALRDALGNRADKRATKDDLVKRYAGHAAAGTPAYAELARLNDPASKDRYVASRLNGTADDLAAAAAKVTGAADPAYAVEWHGEDLMAARYLARYAANVRAAVFHGGLDLREAVLEVTEQAMWQVLSYARDTSLRMNGHGLDEQANAKAAADFISLVRPLIPDMVPARMITG